MTSSNFALVSMRYEQIDTVLSILSILVLVTNTSGAREDME
jgi:hypothetical protein